MELPKGVCALSLVGSPVSWVCVCGCLFFFFRMGREFVVACPANERTPKHHGVIEVGEDIEDHVAEPLSLCESPAVSLAMKS